MHSLILPTSSSNSVVLDTSVIINLSCCAYGVQILTAIKNPILIPENVREELNKPGHTDSTSMFLDRLLTEKMVELRQIKKESASTYELLVLSVGDGEAATLAIATATHSIAIVDDGKARSVAREMGIDQNLAWSLDLFLNEQVQKSLGSSLLSEAIYLALREGRMRIDNERCDAVIQILGSERAKFCTSLPNYKLRFLS